MFGLFNFDSTPMVYGVVMFIGLWSMYRKFMTGQWRALLIEVGVFTLVFKLHGGTMNGGFAAMICAMLAGFFLSKPTQAK
jgi:hypothetical protein